MKIDRKLNLVIPIVNDEGTKEVAYVHATPISREVFETYFFVLSKTFASIYGDGLGLLAGPRVAALLLKKAAESLNQWEGPEGVRVGLVAEYKRLANVFTPGEGGWQMIPYVTAVENKVISEDDAAVIDNALAFFTVASGMHRRTELPMVLDGAANLWGAETTSLSCTEYGASLPTLTSPASSGTKETLLSIPS